MRILEVPATVHRGSWFPGRIVGGAALVVGPVVWFAGLLIRYLAVDHSTSDVEPLAAVAELAAYERNPGLMTAGYALFAAGAILMMLALVTLGRLAAGRCPRLATAGAVFVVVGICARVYYSGVDHTAFQLVERLGVEAATQLVRDAYMPISYGPLRIPVIIVVFYYLGLALLAIAAIRSGTVGVVRGVVVFAAGLWMGVLKEAHVHELVILGLLVATLAPLGVRVLSAETDPVDRPRRVSWL
ncbi:hypothetical protein [Actinokineospora sp. UTMC 2448]|uniref:hypothetical protein n=1 Tax=Actinokineospora sp. UTMC 2448 TaxID=2268449 RepID=UPI0021640BE5|nr:hypothetical protein [Actinokineospora sp. UTMC 2448]